MHALIKCILYNDPRDNEMLERKPNQMLSQMIHGHGDQGSEGFARAHDNKTTLQYIKLELARVF